MFETRHTLPPVLAAFAIHGGNLGRARELFPDAPQPWLDLSTGLNPVPYPTSPLPAQSWTRLPDPAELALLEAVAGRAYGLSHHEDVVAGPGSQALIQALALQHLSTGPRVLVLEPTYSGHAAAWRMAGATVVAAETLDALSEVDVAVVVNPNNPDGRMIPPAMLREAAATLLSRGGMLVVDEAFADVMAPEASLFAGGVPAGAVVLRSFGKTYGLGGLRLGFLIGHPPQTSRVRGALGAWAVSGPALAIGRRAMADGQWLAASRKRLRDDAAALDDVLQGAGLTVIGGTPLFRLAQHDRAMACFEALLRQGILVRPFASRPWLRISPPASAQDRERLRTALNGWESTIR